MSRALPITALEYTVEVGGEPLANGASVEGFAVPPLGHAGSGNYEVGYRRICKGSLSEGLLRIAPLEPKGVFTLR